MIGPIDNKMMPSENIFCFQKEAPRFYVLDNVFL